MGDRKAVDRSCPLYTLQFSLAGRARLSALCRRTVIRSRLAISLKGKWRIIQMPDFAADYPDMVEPAYILFEDQGSGEFAFGCCTGHIWKPAAPKRPASTSPGMAATK